MWKQFGYLFYVIDPRDTFFSSVSQVPVYITEAIPFFVTLIIFEQLVALLTGKTGLKVNDAITSAGQGLLMEQTKLLLPAFIITYYKFIHEHYRLIDLPVNSFFVWFVTFLAIDFFFYWFHRACHEVNILWATHQVHHSSEYFNLSTALRQSVPQLYLHILFYLPLALFLPPTLYLVHFELNTLYQFWIHSQILDVPKFLANVLNTPSHHRVHHGRNRYCIDKNYASVLILWDKIFGTFEPESEEVIFGLTHPVETFNPIKLQVISYQNIFWRLKNSNSWKEKFCILFYGPGWDTDKPRLGDINDIPDVSKNSDLKPFDPQIGFWRQIYVAAHFFVILFFHVQMAANQEQAAQKNIFLAFAFVLLSLFSFGSIFNHDQSSELIEFIRCLIFVAIQKVFLGENSHLREKSQFGDNSHLEMIHMFIRGFYLASITGLFISMSNKAFPRFLLHLSKHADRNHD